LWKVSTIKSFRKLWSKKRFIRWGN